MSVTPSSLTKFTVIAAAVLASTNAHAVLVDFNDSSDFADNFRIFANASVSTVQDGSALKVTGLTSGGSSSIFFYDATPSDGLDTRSTFALSVGQTLTVSVDVASITGGGSSLGFYFVNSAQALTSNAHNLALLNFGNAGGANELARFATYASMSGQSLNAGTTGDGISLNDATFRKVTATYTRVTGSTSTMTLSVGSFSSTFTNTNFTSYSNVEVGLRLFPSPSNPANSYLIDNFTAAIPEPSTFSVVAGLGVMVLAATRRRRAA